MRSQRDTRIADFVTRATDENRGADLDCWDVWSGAIGCAIMCTCGDVCRGCEGRYAAVAGEAQA